MRNWREDLMRTLDVVAGLRHRNRELEAQVAELEKVAITDPLTGLLNRRGAVRALHAAVQRTQRAGMPASVVLVDLDHFKRVNDGEGHAKGDEVLRAVGATIRNVPRPTDVGIRWGGDEFLVLTENDLVGATVLAHRLRRTIQRLWEPEVTASFGVAEFDWQTGRGTMKRAIEEADAALYRAKSYGRDRVEAG